MYEYLTIVLGLKEWELQEQRFFARQVEVTVLNWASSLDVPPCNLVQGPEPLAYCSRTSWLFDTSNHVTSQVRS